MPLRNKNTLDFSHIDLEATNNDGKTGFMLACSYGHKDVVKLLLENSRAKNIDIFCGREDLSEDVRVLIDMHQTKRRTKRRKLK